MIEWKWMMNLTVVKRTLEQSYGTQRAPMIYVITWTSNKGNKKSYSAFLTTEHEVSRHIQLVK